MPSQSNLAQRLSEAISTGSYRPGEWLKQVDLASSFGVTRFEVRRALEELVLRKAVVHIPEKGYRVGEPSEMEILEARRVRVILEVEATRLVSKAIDDDKVQILARLAADFWEAVEKGTAVQRNHSNHLFHDTMYGFAQNAILSELIRDVRDRARGSPIYLWQSVQSMRTSAQEHDDIVAALQERNADLAMQRVREHILKPHPTSDASAEP